MTNFQDKVGFIWSVADLLRGDYKQSEYGKVTPARLERVKDEELRTKLRTSLAKLTDIIKNRDTFTTKLKAALKAADITLSPTALKNLIAALSERDSTADICTDRDGDPEPDADLRDFENVPLTEKIEDYFEREVKPHVPDAWIDHDKTKKGYEIPFTRRFYEYTPLRPLEEIQAEILGLEAEIQQMLKGVMQ